MGDPVEEEAEEKHAMRDENTAKTIDQAAVEAVAAAGAAAEAAPVAAEAAALGAIPNCLFCKLVIAIPRDCK